MLLLQGYALTKQKIHHDKITHYINIAILIFQ